LAVPAIRTLDLDVADREFRVVLGPSGSGKSTLLRLIAGLERPSQGEIRFDGRPMNGVAAADREVGMMFQIPALFPQLTVRENLGLGLTLRGVGRSAVAEAVEAMARRLAIQDRLARLPGQLSGGEQQRVALGRALIRRPAILLLDEPLSNLDAPLGRQLSEEILRLHAESATTTLLVTHDPREVPSPTTQVTVLEAGRMTCSGTMAELRADPASSFVAELWPPLG
jgi:ABC-type sugar transport system ATPase subunit